MPCASAVRRPASVQVYETGRLPATVIVARRPRHRRCTTPYLRAVCSIDRAIRIVQDKVLVIRGRQVIR